MKKSKQFISEGVLTKYEKESGKLRMSGGSWTINLDNIRLEEVHKIVYITQSYVYEIMKDSAIKHGYIKVFRGENKLVVPLTRWTKRSL